MDDPDEAMSWDFGDSLGPWGQGDAVDGATDDENELDEQPIRKGGGPPGRSAFLPGGRLRRLSKNRSRTPDTEFEREPQREPVMSAFRPAAEESAFRPVGDWIADPLPRSTPRPAPEPEPEAPAEGGWDPFADISFGNDPVEREAPPTERPATSVSEPGESTGRHRAFPGGRAKLPRLTPVNEGPEYDFVSTAFIPNSHAGETDDQGARTGFHGYNTYESLFRDDNIAAPLTKPIDGDAYGVLGVQPDDDWKVIVRAHRQLVKANHPDHLVGAPAAERQAAEERLRQINLAYREIKEDRRNADGSSADESDEA